MQMCSFMSDIVSTCAVINSLPFVCLFAGLLEAFTLTACGRNKLLNSSRVSVCFQIVFVALILTQVCAAFFSSRSHGVVLGIF